MAKANKLILLRLVKAPPHISGYVRRFLLEIDKGVFVGKLSTRVIDNLWLRITESEFNTQFRAILFQPTDSKEQGYKIYMMNTKRKTIDLDGFTAIIQQKP